jgi:hypothetical protein
MVSDDTRSVRSARTPSKKEDVDYRVDEEDDEKGKTGGRIFEQKIGLI